MYIHTYVHTYIHAYIHTRPAYGTTDIMHRQTHEHYSRAIAVADTHTHICAVTYT